MTRSPGGRAVTPVVRSYWWTQDLVRWCRGLVVVLALGVVDGLERVVARSGPARLGRVLRLAGRGSPDDQ